MPGFMVDYAKVLIDISSNTCRMLGSRSSSGVNRHTLLILALGIPCSFERANIGVQESLLAIIILDQSHHRCSRMYKSSIMNLMTMTCADAFEVQIIASQHWTNHSPISGSKRLTFVKELLETLRFTNYTRSYVAFKLLELIHSFVQGSVDL